MPTGHNEVFREYINKALSGAYGPPLTGKKGAFQLQPTETSQIAIFQTPSQELLIFSAIGGNSTEPPVAAILGRFEWRLKRAILQASASEVAKMNAMSDTPVSNTRDAALSGAYGNLLSGADATLALDDEFRKHAAIYDHGIMLVAKTSMNHKVVINAKQIALTTLGIARINTIETDAVTIADIYNADVKKIINGGGAAGDQQAAETQKQFFDIVSRALDLSASDIHIQTGWKDRTDSAPVTKIEFRVDRSLVKHDLVGMDLGERLISASFASIDPNSASSSVQTKEGYLFASISRINALLDPRALALRLQFNARMGGRELVLRIIPSTQNAANVDIRALGYAPEHLEMLDSAIRRPAVLHFFSGIVNSGKSTSLVALLSELHRILGDRYKFATIENPPEFVIPFATQHPVRDEDYELAIKAQLRSDRNVVMIGEMRNATEGASAFELVNTGMRCFTTIHASSWYSILDRLRAWEMDPYYWSNPRYVGLLVAQKLIRKVCPTCGVPALQKEGYVRPKIKEKLEALNIDLSGLRAPGNGKNPHRDGEDCPTCRGSGFKGQALVAEVCEPDQKIMSAARAGDIDRAISLWRDEHNGRTILEHALGKALLGEISIEDVDVELGPIGRAEIRAPRLKLDAVAV